MNTIIMKSLLILLFSAQAWTLAPLLPLSSPRQAQVNDTAYKASLRHISEVIKQLPLMEFDKQNLF